MTTTAAQETKAATSDLVTRMLAVDLSTAQAINTKLGCEPTNETDHVVGILTENMQRLQYLRYQQMGKITEFKTRITTLGNEHDKLHKEGNASAEICAEFGRQGGEFKKEAQQLDADRDHLTAIFWGMVKLEFPELNGKGHIEIREGGEVVWIDDDSESASLDKALELLENLFDLKGSGRGRSGFGF
jgi:hypothetical protein